jgi:hypothetical protein
MSEQMTPQEAIEIITESIRQTRIILSDPNLFFSSTQRGKGIANSEKELEAKKMAVAALEASIPRVLTLEEARALEPHTPTWTEYEHGGAIYGVYLHLITQSIARVESVTSRGRRARIWSAWPTDEQRAATPWKEDA